MENIPQKSFERNMNHNYLILSRCDFFGNTQEVRNDYRERMLLDNKIKGLLPVSSQKLNGMSRYYYEINSLQSLDRLLEKNELDYNGIYGLLKGCVGVFEELEKYLLDGEQIILKPEFIYMHAERMEPHFVYDLEYCGDVRSEFAQLIENLLAKINHEDEKAVMLAYQVYRYTRNPNYVLGEIKDMLAAGDINKTAENSDMPKAENADKYFGGKSNENYSKPLKETGMVKQNIIKPEIRKDRPVRNDNVKENIKVNNQKSKNKCGADIIGLIICILIAVAAGTILLGIEVLAVFVIPQQQELYLFGALAMSIMAVVIFISSLIRKKRQERQIMKLQECEDEHGMVQESDNLYKNVSKRSGVQEHISSQKLYISKRNNTSVSQNNISQNKKESTSTQNQQINYFSNDTVCLMDEELPGQQMHKLKGAVNGKEVDVPLNNLPMTIGKLSGLVDFVINDSAVSKMHARIEEHNGQIFISDLNSTNGTIRNGEPIEINKEVQLQTGDKIVFGRTCFTFC